MSITNIHEMKDQIERELIRTAEETARLSSVAVGDLNQALNPPLQAELAQLSTQQIQDQLAAITGYNMPLRMDACFKSVFTQVPNALREILGAVGVPATEEVVFGPTEFVKTDAGGRTTFSDLCIHATSGECIIEMQLSFSMMFRNRSLNNVCKIFSEQYADQVKVQKYKPFKKVYHITFAFNVTQQFLSSLELLTPVENRPFHFRNTFDQLSETVAQFDWIMLPLVDSDAISHWSLSTAVDPLTKWAYLIKDSPAFNNLPDVLKNDRPVLEVLSSLHFFNSNPVQQKALLEFQRTELTYLQNFVLRQCLEDAEEEVRRSREEAQAAMTAFGKAAVVNLKRALEINEENSPVESKIRKSEELLE
jgi:hypothetical protein